MMSRPAVAQIPIYYRLSTLYCGAHRQIRRKSAAGFGRRRAWARSLQAVWRSNRAVGVAWRLSMIGENKLENRPGPPTKADDGGREIPNVSALSGAPGHARAKRDPSRPERAWGRRPGAPEQRRAAPDAIPPAETIDSIEFGSGPALAFPGGSGNGLAELYAFPFESTLIRHRASRRLRGFQLSETRLVSHHADRVPRPVCEPGDEPIEQNRQNPQRERQYP